MTATLKKMGGNKYGWNAKESSRQYGAAGKNCCPHP